MRTASKHGKHRWLWRIRALKIREKKEQGHGAWLGKVWRRVAETFRQTQQLKLGRASFSGMQPGEAAQAPDGSTSVHTQER